VATIAKASAFQANTDSSNETQVRRILRDERLFLASVYYPFIQHMLAEMAPTELYLTIDEFESLKKRRKGVYRAVPACPALLDALDLVHGICKAQAKKDGGNHTRLWTWGLPPLGAR
jgi:hypothetical protein